MEIESIEEITEKINEMKMLLSKSKFSIEVEELYLSKIDAWENDINIMKSI